VEAAPPTEEEFAAFERDYQQLSGRTSEGSRLREARRMALEMFLLRRLAMAEFES
jgi:hypothetical protein